VLACAALVGCGGSTEKNALQPFGPPHEGRGLYELRIDTLSDDCSPPFGNGDFGAALIVVTKERDADEQKIGADVPVSHDRLGDALGAGRTDLTLDEPLIVDQPFAVPGCSAQQHLELTLSKATSARIDVRWTEALTGLAGCNVAGIAPTSDCACDRIFHFDWLHACDSGVAQALECQ